MNSNENALEREFEGYALIMNGIEALKEVNQDMDIPQALNGISRGLDIADKMRKFAVQASNLELVELATELRVELSNSKNALADATEEIAGLKTEILNLKTEISRLNEANAVKDTLILKKGVYYEKNGTEPYCPVCWVNHQVKMPVSPPKLPGVEGFFCSNCKSHVGE